ncbi:hypothetical protein COOONC_09810, partial [Cooperia oncophora]
TSARHHFFFSIQHYTLSYIKPLFLRHSLNKINRMRFLLLLLLLLGPMLYHTGDARTVIIRHRKGGDKKRSWDDRVRIRVIPKQHKRERALFRRHRYKIRVH